MLKRATLLVDPKTSPMHVLAATVAMKCGSLLQPLQMGVAATWALIAAMVTMTVATWTDSFLTHSSAETLKWLDQYCPGVLLAMAVMNGNKMKPPRPGKWVVKANDQTKRQVWKEFDNEVDATDYDNYLRKLRRQVIVTLFHRNMTLNELWTRYEEDFLKLISTGHRKKSSLSAKRRRMHNHILPRFGGKKVRKITKADVETWAQELLKKQARAMTKKPLQRKLAKKGVATIIGILHGVLEYAVMKNLILVNPARGLDKSAGVSLTIEEQVTAVELGKALTREEKRRWFAIADQVCGPLMYTLHATLAETGIRFGEAVALQWGDIDLEGRLAPDGQATIHIQRTFDFDNKVLTLPKGNRRRRVDINDDLLSVLRSYHGPSPRNPNSLVFPPEYAKRGFISNSVVQSWLTKICSQAGITRHFTPHCWRHTYASILLTTLGVSIDYVARQLGHSHHAITEMYARWLPNRCDAAVRTGDNRGLNAAMAAMQASESETQMAAPDLPAPKDRTARATTNAEGMSSYPQHPMDP